MVENRIPISNVEFIFQSLGLIPICGGDAAVNPGAITNMALTDDGQMVLSIEGGETYTLNPNEILELASTLQRRVEEHKIRQKEAIREQLLQQAEAMAELSQGVQPAMIIGSRTIPR